MDCTGIRAPLTRLLYATVPSIARLAYMLRVMTREERDRMNFLCRQIQDEQDPAKFDELVLELNELLEVKHERIHPEHIHTEHKPN
jgi:hypothetical protein